MNIYGLIGFPLEHSFSKKYFTDKFNSESLTECVFENFPIHSIDELPALIKSNPQLKGLSVTIPYKEKVLPYCNVLSSTVIKAGATNCIKIKDENIIAFNTDVIGFQKSFTLKLQPHHKKALVLGSGGAAKAVIFILKKMKIPFTVVSTKTVYENKIISYNAVTEAVLQQHQIIINCTPVGMFPNEDDYLSLPYQYITHSHYLFDLVYNPAETLFLKKGKEKGATIVNGLEMLELQADESWRIWNE